ncbi:MAG: beta-galactosidase [Ruminococcaceae bacterium]|nr:beta-galactosidase [Oscillospiraceae bacterium]
MKKFDPVFTDFPHIVHGGDYNPDQWLDYPDILSEDVRLMKLAGINSATVAIFAWSAIEPQEGVFKLDWLDEVVNNLYKNGIYTILATPSGARPAWLDEKYPEARRTSNTGIKQLHGKRHNHCMSSPIYREKVAKIDSVLAEHFKGNPAVKMWHISNEFSGECFCDLCKQNFRDFLRRKYNNDIKKLNHEWWTGFWSHTYNDFDQIDPPSPIGEDRVHGQNLDWKRFITDITCDFIDNEARTLKAITPDIPVTTNFMGTFEGLDYWKVARHIDVVSWDSYPHFHNPDRSDADVAVEYGLRHDLTRSHLHKPFMLMESTPSCVNWTTVNKMKRPGMHYLASMQVVAHGSDTIQYFQWRKSRGSSEKFHGAVVDHEGSKNTRVFKEVAKLGADLAKLDDVVGTDTKSDVAIIYDWEINWAISDFEGYNERRNYEKTVREFYGCFFNHATNIDFLPLNGDFSKYKMIVAPMMYLVSEEVIDKIEEYVREGGTIVCTYMTGYVNENDLCYLGGWPGGKLRKVFGIWAEELDALYKSERVKNEYLANDLGVCGEFESFDLCEVIHPEGAQIIAEYRSQFYSGMPSVTVNNYGKGKAYYIATRQSVADLEELVCAISDKEGIDRIVPDRLPDGVKVISRTDYDHEYVFITNYSTEERCVEIDDREGLNLLDGKTYSGNITLPGYGVAVLKRKV